MILSTRIKLLQKYRDQIWLVKEGAETIGTGIYTQIKRDACKIHPIKHTCDGGLLIDVPKLYGQLELIPHKDGRKVYDKQVDFDTLGLLTKRFNSKKKYSHNRPRWYLMTSID